VKNWHERHVFGKQTFSSAYRSSGQPGLLELEQLVEDDELHLLAAPGAELCPVLGEPGLQVLLEFEAPGGKLSVLTLQLNGTESRMYRKLSLTFCRY
jgi:hypothetical protein